MNILSVNDMAIKLFKNQFFENILVRKIIYSKVVFHIFFPTFEYSISLFLLELYICEW